LQTLGPSKPLRFHCFQRNCGEQGHWFELRRRSSRKKNWDIKLRLKNGFKKYKMVAFKPFTLKFNCLEKNNFTHKISVSFQMH